MALENHPKRAAKEVQDLSYICSDFKEIADQLKSLYWLFFL